MRGLRQLTGMTVSAATVGLLLTHPAPAAAVPALSCSSVGINATMSTFATVGVGPQDWVENLGFDGHGGMWASELEQNKLVRYAADGTAGTSLTLTSPGATGLEPDGDMFAIYGDSDFNSLEGTSGGVVTFDPTSSAPTTMPFASGIAMPNGGVLDSAGNLYVADSMKAGIRKYSPTGVLDTAFGSATQLESADGVAIDGDTLYVTELFSAGADIVQVPLADPGAHSVLASLAPLTGPDDLAVGPDGALYVATASGQIVRVDPQTGAACVVIDTGVPATSIRFPVDFAPYSADAGDAFVSSELGEILHLHLTGLKPVATPESTPTSTASKLTLTVSRRSVPRHRRLSVTVALRAVPAACADGATVTLGIYHARTGAHGRATLRVHFSRPGPRRLRADKAGCPTATGTVTVTG